MSEEMNFFETFESFPFPEEIKTFYENGSPKEEIRLLNGVKHGFHIKYSENEELIFKKKYFNGKLHGYYFQRLEEFSVERNYLHGKKQGTSVKRNHEGQVIEKCTYRKDLLHGQHYEHDIEIQTEIITMYVNGERHGQRRHDVNHILRLTEEYIAGQKHGWSIWYNDQRQVTNLVLYFYNTPMNIPLNHDLAIALRVSRGLTFVQPPLLELVTQEPDMEEFDMCPICQNGVNEVQDLVALMCNAKHIFCQGCINQYRAANNDAVCPTCRAPLQTV